MRNLLNPKWILAINTIPIVILFLICSGTYSIIHTLLPEESIEIWKQFAIALAVIWQATFIFGVVRLSQKKSLDMWYALFVFITHIPFLFLYIGFSEDIVPFSIPGWMVSNDFEIYPYAFLMPSLLHALLVLVVSLTPNETNRNPWFELLMCLGIPFGFYLVFMVVSPFLNHSYTNKWMDFLGMIFSVILTISFLFFFTRGIFILYKNKLADWKGNQIFWKVPVGILMPVGGLLLNAELNDIFGDFSAPIFYVLAVVNGILFCLPEASQKGLRLLQFLARAVFFPYIIYFFFVFIPYLPLSVFAIILVGTGFLMLTPLLLFVLQSKMLAEDFSYLAQSIHKNKLILLLLACFTVFPLSITLMYQSDRSTLFEALDYIYESELKAPKKGIDQASLARVLKRIRNNQNDRRDRGMNFTKRDTPFLTTYYNWLVLDNLNISAQKLERMEMIFLGESQQIRNGWVRWNRPNSEGVLLTDAKVVSDYDATEDVWRSTIELELTNTDSFQALSEYNTIITLPTGTWISDYYLWIGDRKEKGILAEKKAATWIYNQISRTSRDPGILYYLDDDEVAFKVYPFTTNQVRTTGFELIHKEPVEVEIDGQRLQLGNLEEQKPLMNIDEVANGNVIYVPKSVKEKLPKVIRKPYLHLIVDYSRNQKDELLNVLEEFRKQWDFEADGLEGTTVITVANTYAHCYNMETDWATLGKEMKPQGGFYLERAIKQDLLHQLENPSDGYPVYVVLSDNIDQAIWTKDLAQFAKLHPEVSDFYHFEKDSLARYSFDNRADWDKISISELTSSQEVYAYPNKTNPIAFLPIDGQASVVLKNTNLDFSEADLKANSWESALYLQGLTWSSLLHPEQGTQRWRELVKASFMTQIMTPVTSFIALEDEAQKAMLKKKQEEALSGKKSLDLEDEEIERMSEPAWWLIAGFLILFWLIKNRKKLKLIR